MAKRKKKRKTKSALQQVCHPHAAGIDLGAEEFYAAIGKDKAAAAGLTESVAKFSTFNSGIKEAIEWFHEHGIETIAMESTGNYWVSLHDQLVSAGFEVFIVNASHCKALPGRKTDVCDAQWIQQLHTAGLLRASYIPEEDFRAIRYLMRHRDSYIKDGGREIQRMQKALTEMNVQLHHAVSDIDGWSGRRIIEAIIKGNRNPEELADLRHAGCRTPRQTVIEALDGNFRDEYIFALRQSYEKWQQIRLQIGEAETEIDKRLSACPGVKGKSEKSPAKTYTVNVSTKHELNISFVEHAKRIFGVDLSEIPGVSDGVLGNLLAEVGSAESLKKSFKSGDHFSSWLGLCPDNRITGGNVKKTKTRKVDNPLASALRISAMSLWRADDAIGDFSRKMKARLGKPEGITATAHKLARIIYAMVTTGKPYDPSIDEANQKRNMERQLKNLQRKAAKLGLTLTPATVCDGLEVSR